jgi:hypothetical protein
MLETNIILLWIGIGDREKNTLTPMLGPASLKNDWFVMYGLHSKLVSLIAQASMFVQTKRHQLTTKSVHFP